MKFPQWSTPALLGAGAGAAALTIIGFSWGGWVTGGAATEMSNDASTAAVAAALTPYCVDMARTDPNSANVLADLESASSFQRRGIIEDSGWATPIGEDTPNRALAQACQLALTADA